MRSQKSNEATDQGTLFLIPTPIGNLEDMTFRAIRLMQEADLIAAEDTRNTKKLCSHFDISTPLASYHEHNKETSGRQLVERLLKGDNIALVSDAGMPCISDPGYEIVRAAIEADIAVVPVPGPNAALTALIASGINPQPFYFCGFLPRGKKERKAELERLKRQDGALLLYEAPHRLKDTLKDMAAVWGDRKIVLCRELTKKFEEFLRGRLSSAVEWAEKEEIRGEFCLIVEGNSDPDSSEGPPWWALLGLKEHVEHYIENENLTSKEAIKRAASDRKVPKREVYEAYHIHGK
ncbi:16S rRNA (cytidine(1402)-2'-O)-methyltransferase [Siminovitchia fortis]|uniref:Ribosomal RNA small subunit methyltransferase I n=1 Tax=Siminovitchia fortis TaxID=254758 RepID=A0A443INK6_9BACI|nr:16S rRNA (cytidine(1402)-2'-O)-methyltransferase [Siminovitchia fortis]RWR07175.1 16S rRNA (cytidine(1402)-2'-O)-methyltransferase [Siminovitchia fortis]WHY81345.1 16S rRNA (cytidine(1402)-2'-O)-methyltransferase [Siminovitchia fortis]